MKITSILKKDVKVYYRILPEENICSDFVKVLDDKKTVCVRCLQDAHLSKISSYSEKTPKYWTFAADQVFLNLSQEEIYKCTTEDILNKLFGGNDVILAAFGQAGSGKSMTIGGLYNDIDDRGILPRLITDLFLKLKDIEQNRNLRIRIEITFFETIKNKINDLLKPFPSFTSSIKDIVKIKVKTTDDVMKLLFTGEGRKNIFENAGYSSNCASSIFTFHVSLKDLNFDPIALQELKLHVLDLAGIDSIRNFSYLFKGPQEIGFGNLVKTQLEQFFLILSKNIPSQTKPQYRLSPMIQFLGDSLSGKSILRFIGHISANEKCLPVTLSTLRFGQMISDLSLSINNTKNNYGNNLKHEMKICKNEMLYASSLSKQDLALNLSRDRYDHVRRTVDEYLQDKTNELALLNVSDVKIALQVMKNICKGANKSDNYPSIDSPSIGLNSARRSKKNLKSVSGNLNKKQKEKSKMSIASLSLGRLSPDSRVASVANSRVASVEEKINKGNRSSKFSLSKTRKSSLNGSKRKLSSNVSVLSVEGKTKSDCRTNAILIPDIIPEYKEAWNKYIVKKGEEYNKFRALYEECENMAKSTYTNYLNALKSCRLNLTEIDKRKNEVLLAKFTKDFKNYDSTHIDIEKCCTEKLKLAEKNVLIDQEIILEHQVTLKSYIEQCKEIKKELKTRFDEFCRQEYSTIVENVENTQDFMDVEKTIQSVDLEKNEATYKNASEDSINRFASYKNLLITEKRKRVNYKLRNKTWKSY